MAQAARDFWYVVGTASAIAGVAAGRAMQGELTPAQQAQMAAVTAQVAKLNATIDALQDTLQAERIEAKQDRENFRVALCLVTKERGMRSTLKCAPEVRP